MYCSSYPRAVQSCPAWRRALHCLVACAWETCRLPLGKSTVKQDWQVQNVGHMRAGTPMVPLSLEAESLFAGKIPSTVSCQLVLLYLLEQPWEDLNKRGVTRSSNQNLAHRGHNSPKPDQSTAEEGTLWYRRSGFGVPLLSMWKRHWGMGNSENPVPRVDWYPG